MPLSGMSRIFFTHAVTYILALLLAGGIAHTMDKKAPITIDFADTNGRARLERYRETDKLIHFVIEADGMVHLNIEPEQFQLKPGTDYSVNTSYYDPFIVRAETEGQLTLSLDTPGNCTVVIEALQGGNLIINPGYEEINSEGVPVGWQIESRNDGEADTKTSVSLSERFQRSGKHSMMLVQGEYDGYAAIRTSQNIPVEAGTEYLISGYYHLEEPQFGSSLVFLASVSAPDKETLHFRDDYLMPLIYTDAGEWRRSFTTFRVPDDYKDASVSIFIAATRAPFTAYWDDLELRIAPTPARQYSKPLSPEQIARRYSHEEVREQLAARQPIQIQPPQMRQSPLMIDGQAQALYGFTANYPISEWPMTSAHSDFIKAGVKLHWVPLNLTRVTERYGGPIWIADGEYDFSVVDRILEDILGYDPTISVLFYTGLKPYSTFCDVHPEAAWINAKGRKSVGQKEHIRDESDRKPGEPLQHSLAAPAFRREAGDLLQELGKHLASSELGRAVAGIHLAGGTDGQWFVPGWVAGFGDYDQSPGSVDAFREWLNRRYGADLAAFREAWGNPGLTFETATMPEERERSPEKYFLDPGTGEDRRVIDANRFVYEGVSETINILARAFKEGIGRPAIVTTYYPNKHSGLRAWLEQPYVDGTVGVLEYGRWRAPGQTGEIATFPGSLRLHGKFFLSELDFRTENATSWSTDAHEFRRTIVITHGEEESANQVRRDLGAALAQGGGAWHYSLTGNSWNSRGHMAYIAEAQKTALRAAYNPMPDDHGQMAVFSDEEIGCYGSQWQIYGPRMRYYGNYGSRVALNRSGLSWDHYLLSDLDHPERPEYRLNIFLTAGTITPDQIQWVQEHLQRNGNVVVFINNAGYSLGDGFEENIRALTGMTVRVDLDHQEPQGFVATGGDPLSEGVENIMEQHIGPLFYVDDPTAAPLALLTETDKVGMAVKRFTGWTSVYISRLGGFTPRLLRNLAKEAGITPIGPEDDVTYAGNGFLVIHALKSGEKTLRWVGKSDVIDLRTGETIVQGVNTLTFTMKAKETRWFQRRLLQN